MNKEWWEGLSWQVKFFIILLSCSMFLAAATKLGVVSFEPTGVQAPPFDRKECLQRKQEELFPGMFITDLSDEALSRIAATCAHEEFG